mmetsp:Transcript_18133/g.59224  ORF Transcript_18133/g.59224 Transcript_18133/m.59224 type:complete len:338 (-) Transcript_18133:618-1631(-)
MHPASTPPKTPAIRLSGPWLTSHASEPPWPSVRPEAMEKPLIASTSSKEAAATTSDGIPLSTPYPLLCSSNIPNTTTAGETAPRMKPRAIPSAGGMPKINTEAPPTTTASETPGIAVSLTAMSPMRRKASRSSSRPERVKMMDSPAALMLLDHASGSPSTSSPGRFRKTMPDKSIPRSGGSPTYATQLPPTCDASQIRKVAHAAPLGRNSSPKERYNTVYRNTVKSARHTFSLKTGLRSRNVSGVPVRVRVTPKGPLSHTGPGPAGDDGPGGDPSSGRITTMLTVQRVAKGPPLLLSHTYIILTLEKSISGCCSINFLSVSCFCCSSEVGNPRAFWR